jgi:hypothetical protein
VIALGREEKVACGRLGAISQRNGAMWALSRQCDALGSFFCSYGIINTRTLRFCSSSHFVMEERADATGPSPCRPTSAGADGSTVGYGRQG